MVHCGQAAHMQGDEDAALAYYRTASRHATSTSLQRVARWGRFVSSVDAESPDAEVALTDIVADQTTGTTAIVDRWNAQLLYEIRVGGIRSLHDARAAAELSISSRIQFVEPPFVASTRVRSA